uniref:Uncharacterized protein n=1 Tax=Siphoviridae sp. ctrCv3 TaxID=2827954 RepID=A0A8S5SCL9_9CAUD|nr:MAG TPA: hypothetical protein [Siphoviridae sp. ctrCv3]
MTYHQLGGNIIDANRKYRGVEPRKGTKNEI